MLALGLSAKSASAATPTSIWSRRSARQRIIRNLGRKEDVERRGDLDRLARSAARLAQRSMILSLIDEGSAPALTCKRIGPPLLFARLWRDTKCREVVEGLLADRGFGL